MARETTLPASLDLRGFLRVRKASFEALGCPIFPYADIWVDKKEGQIAFQMSETVKETSFRFIDSSASVLLYLKGAIHFLGKNFTPGKLTLDFYQNQFILFSSKQNKPKWELFPCRNSAGIPMVSLDSRGTLILDRRTRDLLNTEENPSCFADYDPNEKTFKLTFGKDGFLNVKTIASHATASLAGTLSSNGLARPKKRLRLTSTICGKTLTFSASALQKLTHKTSEESPW